MSSRRTLHPTTLLLFLILAPSLCLAQPRFIASKPYLHPSPIILDQDQSQDLVLHQNDRDLHLEITGENAAATILDSRETGPEHYVLTGPGTFRLRVLPTETRTQPSPFALSLQPPRPTTPEDRARQTAQLAASQAKQGFDVNRPAATAEAALSLTRQARDAWTSAHDSESAAAAQVQEGSISFYLGRHEDARRSFETALPLLISPDSDWIRAEAQNNLGTTLWQLGEFAGAIRSFEQSLQGFQRVKHIRGASASLNNLGILYGETGEYRQARAQYRQALTLARQLGEPIAEGYILHNLSAVFAALGEPTEALASVQAARRMFNTTGQLRAEGRAWLRIGEIQFAAGSRSAATASLRRAIELASSARDSRTLGDAYILEARGHRTLEPALPVFERAEHAFRELGSHQAGMGNLLHHRGLARLESGQQLSEAEADLLEALRIRRNLAMHDATAETLHALARLEARRGSWPAALDRMLDALAEAETVRQGVGGARGRMDYLAHRHHYYGFAIHILMRLHEAGGPSSGFAARALEMAERAKARALLETISAPARDRNPQLRELAAAINFWSFRLSESKTEAGSADRVRSRVEQLLSEYNALEAETIPQGAKGRLLTAGMIQKQLLTDDGAALVEYFLDREGSWVWLVTRRSITVRKLAAGQAAIEAAAKAAYEQVSRPPPSGAAAESDANAALAALSRLLLGALPDLRSHRRLLVSLDGGHLARLPFGLLAPAAYGGDPLLAAHEIVSIPSASVAMAAAGQRNQKRTPASGQIAILADPVFDSADTRLGANSNPGASGSYPRLAFSRSEAKAIHSLFDPRQSLLALDFDASRNLFDSGALARYALLHVATHAAPDAEHPALSSLVLSLRTASGAKTDGFVRSHDIGTMPRLSCDVLVLSGCGTGLGKSISGEGPLSLAREFLEAGAGSVAVSFWNVEDESTASLMREFYRDLTAKGDRARPAASLQRAQLAIRRNDGRWRHPYYWGGWAVVGNGN